MDSTARQPDVPRFRDARFVGAVVLSSLPLVLGGCAIGALFGGMAQSYNETASHTVEAEYTGLQGKSYAVIVAADRSIEADFPGLVAELTTRIDARLRASAGSLGHVPATQVLSYIYNTPGWPARSREELAKDLGGPDRLVYLDLTEFRLNDPGNAYLWNGAAVGNVGVFEMDGPLPEDYAYEKTVAIRFPDKEGFGPTDFSREQVVSVLLKRFVDRASWLFYDHEEKIMPDY